MPNNVAFLKKNGYLVIRNFFDNSEITELKKFASKHDHDGSIDNFRCLLSLDGSGCIFKNPKLKDLITNLLGSKPVYFGDSSLTINKGESFVAEGNMAFHRDCADRVDYNAPDWTSPEPYSLIRIGIYLDDYSKKSGGIAFRKGSNRPEKIRKLLNRKFIVYFLNLWELLIGNHYYASPKPGDLVIWQLNTDHSGNAKFLKLWPNRAITKYTHYFPSFLTSPPNRDKREAFFIVFGKNGSHVDRYIKQNKERDFMVHSWIESFYKKEILEDENFFNLIDVGDELRKLKKINQLPENRREWRQIPY
ncbi:MAG: hypothetical protein CMF45_08300 [Legionellales bacterium]|nr:hypothetical protein [Legionellales bacterium]|tara:strand:+ start:3510 stop:4424 length:915 start_codon:yes stop_codon:yes gene_type:complete